MKIKAGEIKSGYIFDWQGRPHILRTNLKFSQVVQWLKICPSMQGSQVRSLIGKHSTRQGTTWPMGHNYWAYASQQDATTMRSSSTLTKSSPYSRQEEKAQVQQWRPDTTQKTKKISNNNIKIKIFVYIFVYFNRNTKGQWMKENYLPLLNTGNRKFF